jgi:hypothetical protein
LRWQNPPLMKVLEAIADNPPASWVRAIYMRKFGDYIRSKWIDKDDKHLVELLKRLPEGPGLLDELVREDIRGLKRYLREGDSADDRREPK